MIPVSNIESVLPEMHILLIEIPYCGLVRYEQYLLKDEEIVHFF